MTERVRRLLDARKLICRHLLRSFQQRFNFPRHCHYKRGFYLYLLSHASSQTCRYSGA